MAESNEILDNVVELFPEFEPAKHPDGLEMTEWVFMNEKENPSPRQLFHLLYKSVFLNKLGIMNALNTSDGRVYTLIVGVDQVDGEVVTWPLAKLLTEYEQNLYKAPDGNGNFV